MITQRWEPWKTCQVPKMFLLHEEEMRPEAELIGRQDLPANELKLSLWGKSAARDDDRIPARAGRCVWSFEHKQALQSQAREVLAQLVLSWDRCTWGRGLVGSMWRKERTYQKPRLNPEPALRTSPLNSPERHQHERPTWQGHKRSGKPSDSQANRNSLEESDRPQF